jgi:hypothetical protein
MTWRFQAIGLFNEMKHKKLLRATHRQQTDSPPTSMKLSDMESRLITYVCVVNALARIADVSRSAPIVCEIPADLLMNPVIQNALINMWTSEDGLGVHVVCNTCFHWTRTKAAVSREQNKCSNVLPRRITSDTPRSVRLFVGLVSGKTVHLPID